MLFSLPPLIKELPIHLIPTHTHYLHSLFSHHTHEKIKKEIKNISGISLITIYQSPDMSLFILQLPSHRIPGASLLSLISKKVKRKKKKGENEKPHPFIFVNRGHHHPALTTPTRRRTSSPPPRLPSSSPPNHRGHINRYTTIHLPSSTKSASHPSFFLLVIDKHSASTIFRFHAAVRLHPSSTTPHTTTAKPLKPPDEQRPPPPTTNTHRRFSLRLLHPLHAHPNPQSPPNTSVSQQSPSLRRRLYQ